MVEGWTEGRFNAFITSTLRGGMRRFPNKWQCLKNSYVGRKKSKSGRNAAHYKCAICSLDFTSSNVQVDHIHPVVDPILGFTSWDDYITRLFCSVEGLQTLCLKCHKLKTQDEKKIRASSTPKMKKTKHTSDESTKKPRSIIASKRSKASPKVAPTARKSGKRLTKKPA